MNALQNNRNAFEAAYCEKQTPRPQRAQSPADAAIGNNTQL
jgi:hypothetical protein